MPRRSSQHRDTHSAVTCRPLIISIPSARPPAAAARASPRLQSKRLDGPSRAPHWIKIGPRAELPTSARSICRWCIGSGGSCCSRARSNLPRAIKPSKNFVTCPLVMSGSLCQASLRVSARLPNPVVGFSLTCLMVFCLLAAIFLLRRKENSVVRAARGLGERWLASPAAVAVSLSDRSQHAATQQASQSASEPASQPVRKYTLR